ncbi:MAG: nicotinate phosphoribosyltransferase [Spirochaetes bacterium]|nr:MAG: nicotinate phosphoribosyltransferase [Spirochaetota bacterium]
MSLLTERALDVLLETDAYKLGHLKQYPARTEVVFSNLTARGTRIDGVDRTVFFGLQAVLKQLVAKWDAFFALSGFQLAEVLAEYREFVGELLDVDPRSVDVRHFVHLHGLGYLPIRVKAFREGSLVPLRVPYLTIENTIPLFFWLTNYLETTLSAELWQPITSATIAWRARRLLDERARQSGADLADVDYQGHDFSFRGMEGIHAAAASSAGHLVSFKGTDTLPAIRFVKKFYGSTGVVGRSVNATEHSVMTAEGRDGEFAVYERLIDTYPNGVLSIVSDSYDLWNVLTVFLPKLKDKIMARNGKLVIRPDSGDPELIVCGDPSAPEDSPARKGVVNILAEIFGTTTDAAGFKMLDPHIGVIYGDGITYDRADAITANLISQGYTSTTTTLGFGSFTYQMQTRDTFKMAVKATWVRVDGEGRDIFKDPITDDGSKKSATGRLAVRSMMNGTPYLVEHATQDQEDMQLLRTVFEDGQFLNLQDFDDVRYTLKVCEGVYARYRGESS